MWARQRPWQHSSQSPCDLHGMVDLFPKQWHLDGCANESHSHCRWNCLTVALTLWGLNFSITSLQSGSKVMIFFFILAVDATLTWLWWHCSDFMCLTDPPSYKHSLKTISDYHKGRLLHSHKSNEDSPETSALIIHGGSLGFCNLLHIDLPPMFPVLLRTHPLMCSFKEANANFIFLQHL